MAAPAPGSATQFLGTPLEPTGIRSQVAGYLSATSGHADANSLYFVWGGPNDFLVALGTPSPDFSSIISAGVSNLVSSVDQRYRRGSQLLLPLMPDLGATPRPHLGWIDPRYSARVEWVECILQCPTGIGLFRLGCPACRRGHHAV